MTNSQQRLAKRWCKAMAKLPQWQAYAWWLKLLDSVIPYSCPFERTHYAGKVLICYVPKLCMLNPWYDALLEYRFGNLEPIRKEELLD